MNDKKRDRIMDKMNKLTHDDVFMTQLEAEKWDKWEENSKMDYALSQGKPQGFEEGITEGIEQNTINVIKNMIRKNMPLNDISDITGKSIEEIREIIKK